MFLEGRNTYSKVSCVYMAMQTKEWNYLLKEEKGPDIGLRHIVHYMSSHELADV